MRKEMKKMTVVNRGKCTECGSRDLEEDEVRGELVCNECGLVQEDKAIDTTHPQGRVGEGAHNTALRNDVGGNKLGSVIDRKEALKVGKGNLSRTSIRAHAAKNQRAKEVLREIARLTDSTHTREAAKALLETGFTNNNSITLSPKDLGPKPGNQMRFMHQVDKNATYVIRCSAIATMMVLSDIGTIPYRIWKMDARANGIEENDCITAKKIIRKRLDLASLHGLTGMKIIRDRTTMRKRALEAWSERLRVWIHTQGIEGAQQFLDWVEEKRKELDKDGQGPLSGENADMLMAMIATVALSELSISEVTKRAIAEDAFLLTVGGVNARLKQTRRIIEDPES
jgi:hypothetical protein